MHANKHQLKGFVLSTLVAVPGMRDYNVASDQFAKNFELLEAEDWQETLSKCNQLTILATPLEERAIARYIASKFHGNGIGPKQARNILQALGLTRYEIPLDSRGIKWLRERLDFPFPVSGTLLADPEYYEFVLDKIQDLCRKCDEFPCMLDAAIFAENDPDNWTPEMLRY